MTVDLNQQQVSDWSKNRQISRKSGKALVVQVITRWWWTGTGLTAGTCHSN